MSLSNFIKLVSNELIKTYIRKSTWIMYIILAGLIIGFGMLTEVFNDMDEAYYSEDNWRELMEEENQRLMEEYEAFQEELRQEGEDLEFYYGPEIEKIEQNNLYLEHDIQPSKYGASQFVVDNAGLLSVVSLLTIIVAAGMIAHEYRWGTIKLLLVRPISRTTILASKYVAVLLFALITLLFVLFTSWIVGLILFGFDGINPHMLIYHYTPEMTEANYKLVPVYTELVSSYGYNLVNLVMMTTFAFMISAIFRNSSLAIGLAIFLMMSGNTIVSIFYDKPFAKYILFANTDLKQYADGTVWIEGMTLGFSITMLVIYYVVFLILSWVFFVKRDVAGH